MENLGVENNFSNFQLKDRVRICVGSFMISVNGEIHTEKKGNLWVNYEKSTFSLVKPNPRYKHAGKYQIKMRKKHR